MKMMFNLSEHIESLLSTYTSYTNEYDEAYYGIGAIMPQEMTKDMSQTLLSNPDQYGI